MQIKTIFRNGIRLLVAVLVSMVMVPSAAIAADNWSYPTSKPSNPFGGGNGSKNNPYIISSAQHLANLAYMVSHDGTDYDGKYFLQTRDIVLNDNVIDGATKETNGSIRYNKNKDYFDKLKPWQPIGARIHWYGGYYFEGIYDGGGHSVSGVYCREPLEKQSSKDYRHVGLFGMCDEARISNLTIKDSFFSMCGNFYKIGMGTLVGYCEETSISNCHAENCVISGDGDMVIMWNWYIGGLVGDAYENFTARECSFDGIVDVYAKRGSDEKEDGASCYIGGLVGRNRDDYLFSSHILSIENCRTSGQLLYHESDGTCSGYLGDRNIGGIIGEAISLKSAAKHISRCINKMDISVFGDAAVFPMVEDIHVAGIAQFDQGAFGDARINCSECVNFGNISIGGTSHLDRGKNLRIWIGGIVTAGNIDNCFNYGNISVAPMNSADGVKIGQWVYEGTVKDCFAYNTISYAFDKGTPKVYLTSADKVTLNNTRSYTTFNGEAKQYDIKESDFTSQDYVNSLNTAAHESKYGLIKENGASYNGYLSLTSLGAFCNSLAGSGTEDDPYIIGNANDLRTFADMVATGNSFKDNVFKLTDNIDMTNEPAMDAIGFKSPFDGILDGDGHYIRGLKVAKGYLFYQVTGTIKNLAIDDIKSQSSYTFAGIAYIVGDGTTECGIENCYVIGNPDVKTSDSDYTSSVVGGICCQLYGKASISDCYYTGNVKITKGSDNGTSTAIVRVGGIATMAHKGSAIKRCYAVIGYDADAAISGLMSNLGGIVDQLYDDVLPDLSRNYYHIDIADTSQKPTVTRNYTDTEERAKYNIKASDLGDKFANGWYYPVLKSVYHYDCTDSKGNATALDPAGYAPTTNDILTLTPTDEQLEDTKMWQLPNVAVYSEEYGAEMLTNFTIIPDADGKNYPLRYKPTKVGVSVKGLVTYPWKVDRGYANWGSFCLPGVVEKSNLPDGCKLYVGGTYADGKMNIVEVDSIPAGVPFLVRYDNRADVDTVFITMTGDLVMQPQTADAASSLKGTYEPVEDSNIHFIVYEDETSDGTTKIYMHNSSSVDCFRAYVVGDNTGLIELTDYLLLDEQSNNTDEVVAANDDKSLNIKLRRSIRTGGWNTVCLPFDMGSDKVAAAFGDGTRVEKLTDVSYDATTNAVVMKFSAETSMEAGVPYLVYPTNDATILDLGQCNVKINTDKNTNVFSDVYMGNSTYADISMVGSYGKAYLVSTDDEDEYFLQQNKFYRATQANPVVMSGFRCYFKVASKTGTPPQTFSSARVVHSDGSTTDIKLVDMGLGTAGTRIYDIQGIQHYEMRRGVNIVGGKKVIF